MLNGLPGFGTLQLVRLWGKIVANGKFVCAVCYPVFLVLREMVSFGNVLRSAAPDSDSSS